MRRDEGAGAIDADDMDAWRLVGDEPADALARDLLAVAGAPGSDETDVLRRAVREVATGVASPSDDVRKWLLEGPDLPAWADDRLIARGQAFFARWPLPIATTLFCASLPTAYAAPHGAAVMVATSQLNSKDDFARRLAETGRMVFDVMDPTRAADVAVVAGLPGKPGPGDGEAKADSETADPHTDGEQGQDVPALHRGSQGYLSVRGVRLLHGLVRQALLSRPGVPWPAEHGTPINQEDQLGTLMTFTVTVLDGLERLGITVAPDDAEAYFHTWRVVGALLGIDEQLLPPTLAKARDTANVIAARQHGPSAEGTALAGELVRQMRLAMPAGCQDLPATLVHLLVPDIAELLEVPEGGRAWTGVVDSACRLVRAAHGLPRVRDLVATGPGSVVGRSVLWMFIDREEQSGAPPYRLAAGDVLRSARAPGGWRAAARRTARRQRRGDTVGIGPHTGPTSDDALAALPRAVTLPIGVRDVRLLASKGFPLWEPVEVMVQRNRGITAGYTHLSRQLAELIAGPGALLDANWCTFASWSSMTIGTLIDDLLPEDAEDPDEDGPAAGGVRTARPGPVPGRIAEARSIGRSVLDLVSHRSIRRGNGASFRTLAAGNRVVFLEVGLSIAMFVDHFGTGDAGEIRDIRDRDTAWSRFWKAVEAQLATFGSLDPSWMLTDTPPPDDLRLGLRQYFDAMAQPDPALRSQHVLAGNLLLASYEQRRVDGYVWAAMALFTERAMRRLICDRTGALDGLHRGPSRLYAKLMTRRMTLHLPGEVLEIAAPVPPPADPQDRWSALDTDAEVTLPILQALITRFQLASGRTPTAGCRNWTSFDERMRTIGNLFRSRQQQASLFEHPLSPTRRQ